MFKRSTLLLVLALVACSSVAVTPAATAVPTVAVAASATAAIAAGPMIGSCPQLPENNYWNAPVDTLPVHARSAQYVNSLGASTGLHMDFGSGTWEGAPIGIPYVVVNGGSNVQVTFNESPDESDAGPYVIPPNAPIEGNGVGDSHVLVVDQSTCTLYELYAAEKIDNTHWTAGSGAIYNLNSNALRPAGWTSADAAGLPILPGLARLDEAQTGTIRHALRFTAEVTQRAYVWPARHFASDNTSLNVPPMGVRFRLKASVDISGFSPQARIIAQAMKTYGIVLADNGSNWYISGAPHPNWNNDVLHELDVLVGSNFEAVDTSSLMVNPNSGEVAGPSGPLDFHTFTPMIRR